MGAQRTLPNVGNIGREKAGGQAEGEMSVETVQTRQVFQAQGLTEEQEAVRGLPRPCSVSRQLLGHLPQTKLHGSKCFLELTFPKAQ